MTGQGVRHEHLERHVRVLEHPDRVARVEAHAHDVRADGIDHHLHLTRLQIAAVVFDGELHAGIHDPRAEPAHRGDHVVDVHVDLRPLRVAAEDAAHARGAEDLRRPQRPRDLKLERPQLRVERARARADGTVRQLELDPEAVGVRLLASEPPLRHRAPPAGARPSPTSV